MEQEEQGAKSSQAKSQILLQLFTCGSLESRWIYLSVGILFCKITVSICFLSVL